MVEGMAAPVKKNRPLDSKFNPPIMDIPIPRGGGISRSNMKNQQALDRLKTIEGHIKGVEKMVESEQYCIDIIRQIQAIQAALNKVNAMILDNHLNSCLITAVRGDDPDERERVLKEVAEVYEAATKI
jgi:DNA-binding FrmR family transcriptional regulator